MRDGRGLLRKQLADAAGLDPSTVTRLESGERGPSREVVERLAAALDASSEELHGLLTAAELLPAEAAILLDEPELARLSAVLADPALTVLHRRLLLTYVELAVAHAAALGYAPAQSGPRR
jgi:transcriptional regulator with XRE-family HTH domain